MRLGISSDEYDGWNGVKDRDSEGIEVKGGALICELSWVVVGCTVESDVVMLY